jgi:UDPglucose 6-dehydrogenase
MTKISIFSIIGLGFVGNAMYTSFISKGLTEKDNLFGYDKFKNGGIGNILDILKSDIVFLALPTPYSDESKSYNLDSIHEICVNLNSNNFKGVVVIKSTIEPETTSNLSKQYSNLQFIHNPEFLSSRTAFEDFNNQKHIVLGRSNSCTDKSFNLVHEFYSTYYPEAKISICTSLESECMKLFANCFYAVKVQFFTELYLVCKANYCDFEKVKTMMVANNWINPSHTNIPGPDGLISYGGMCFPKDTNALNEYMKKINSPNLILESCIQERNLMRSDNKTNIYNHKVSIKYQLILIALLFFYHFGFQIYVVLFQN